MLDEKDIPYHYREYTREPLSEQEIRGVLRELGLAARDLLRPRDSAYTTLGLTGEEPESELIRAMADHPTLMQRPIGRIPGRTVLGRPAEQLLELASGSRRSSPTDTLR